MTPPRYIVGQKVAVLQDGKFCRAVTGIVAYVSPSGGRMVIHFKSDDIPQVLKARIRKRCGNYGGRATDGVWYAVETIEKLEQMGYKVQ